jgi:hypothetical protein
VSVKTLERRKPKLMDAKRKLDRLFQSAQKEPVPQPSEDFVSNIVREVGRGPQAQLGLPTAPRTEFGSVSVFDQLASLFPRLAMASALAIALSVAADYCLANFVQRDFSTSAAEISEQWLFGVR